MGNKVTFRSLIKKFASSDPLDEARKKIAMILEGDIEKAKQRYMKFKRRKE